MSDLTVLTAKTIGGLPVIPATERPPYLNILIYGDTGAGKTRFAGSASEVPEMSPVLFIDVEGGTFTLESCYPEVEVVRIRSWAELQPIYDDLYDGKWRYKTVVIDSLSELQQFNMETIMLDLQKKGRKSGGEVEIDVPDQREWGISRGQIRRTVTAFRDLPMHSIFTALERQDRNKRTGNETTKPSLPGKLAGEIGGFVDEMFYMYSREVRRKEGDKTVVENKRLILTSRTEDKLAKDRSGRLPLVVETPTVAEIWKLMGRG